MFAQRDLIASRAGGMRSRWPLIWLAAALTSAIAAMMLCLTPNAAEAAVSVNLSSLNDATAVSATSLTTAIAAVAIVLFGAAIRSRHH